MRVVVVEKEVIEQMDFALSQSQGKTRSFNKCFAQLWWQMHTNAYRNNTIYIRTLKKQPEVMHDWNDTIWTVMIEKAIVHRNGEVTFAFANGTEIKVGA